MRLAGIPFFAIPNALEKPISWARIFAAVLCCCAFTSCGIGENSCATFVWNPGGIDSPSPACPFTQGNGTANVSISASFEEGAGTTSPNLEHVYVTVVGIEARPSADAGMISPNWQELAPELEEHPMQLDLLQHNGESCRSKFIANSEIPGGVYTAIRLRLSANGTASGNQPGESSAGEDDVCGNVGKNCAVTARGEIRPLIFEAGDNDLNIGQDQLEGGYIRILPDQGNNVMIKFDPYGSMAVPARNGIKIIPRFTASIDDTCESNSLKQTQASSD